MALKNTTQTDEQRVLALVQWKGECREEALPYGLFDGMMIPVDIGSRVWVVERDGRRAVTMEGEHFWKECYLNGAPTIIGAGFVIGFASYGLLVVNWRPGDANP
jgi:hypothetical protein